MKFWVGGLLIAATSMAVGTQARAEVEPSVVISIDPTMTFQTIDGFGTSVRLWDDPHLCRCLNTVTGKGASVPEAVKRQILSQLYADLGLTRSRGAPDGILNPQPDGSIEPVNDNDDPLQTDLSKFYLDWIANDGQAEFVRDARAYGLRTWFFSPGWVEDWMHEGNPDEYVEWAMVILRRWRTLGLEMPYYSIINEPGAGGKKTSSGRWMRTVVSLLGRRMRAEGLKTMVVIPDDVNAGAAYGRALAIMEDPDARRYVGALAYHMYGTRTEDAMRMAALGRRYGVPVWMTEHYTGPDLRDALAWVVEVHKLLADYGVSAVDYLFGFASPGPGTLIAIEFDHARYARHRLTDTYYAFGHFTRYVRPGDVRIQATTSATSLLASAYRGRGQLTFVVINQTTQDQRAALTVRGAAPASFTAVRTSPTERWNSLGPMARTASGFVGNFPAQTITTLVGQER